jgi:hypothetical protein
MMVLDSHTTRPSSSMTGTRPCGFIVRNSGASRPPASPPALICSCARSSSPIVQSAFCTLNALRRPQIFSIARGRPDVGLQRVGNPDARTLTRGEASGVFGLFTEVFKDLGV